MFFTNTAGSASRLECNCRPIRDDRDEREGRIFICREVEETGFDGIRRIRLLCRQIERGTGLRVDDINII